MKSKRLEYKPKKLKGRVEKIINNIYPISKRSFMSIEESLHYESLKKGETFIQKNRRNESEYFILNGVCKSYLISPNGNEITVSFFTENSVITPHAIRTPKNISNQYFKALTDVEFASINSKSFEQLMIQNIEIRNFANTVLQNELISKVEKEIGLASLSAKERLIEFRKNYRLLENLVPHTDIASYLGITNISLSRLRKKLIY